MLYLATLTLIIAAAIYICARLFPRNHTTTRAAKAPHRPRHGAGALQPHATEGEQP